MTRIYNGTKFTEVIYVYKDETLKQLGLLIHDLKDEFHDGDGIIGNCCTLPESEDEARTILQDEYLERLFWIDKNGMYHVE